MIFVKNMYLRAYDGNEALPKKELYFNKTKSKSWA